MQKYFLVFIIAFCFTSCKRNTVNPDLLLGDWEFVTPKTIYDKDSNISTDYYRSDFRFEKDSIFELNDGFFKRADNQYTQYMGQESKYYIDYDSLYILNSNTNKYFAQKISHLSKDTLALYDKDSNMIFYYKKKKIEKPTQVHLSQIIVSLEPCFGACPVSSISIDSEGNIIYFGESNTQNKGLFQGKVNKKKFQEIVSDLNKIHFTELKNKYSAGDVTDLPGLSVSFIENNKILKTIYDYGNTEPRNLKGILNKIIYLYQEADLQKIDYDYPIVNPAFPPNFLLNDSESFYLQTLLLKATKTETEFIPKYTQKSSLILPENFDYEKYNEMQRRTETNGRYFRMENKNHQFSTFDIGFDFFETNEIFSKK